jgi:rhomboid protease GluP
MSQEYIPPTNYPTQSPPPGQVMIESPQVRPMVTYVLAGIIIITFLLQMGTQSFFGGDLPAMLGMKDNAAIVQGQYWRLITPMFLHGSILHIAFNLYALMIFGPGLERYYGHGRYLALFLISGFAGNVASFLFSTSPSLGSSTAIFGLLGAEGVFLYQNRSIFGRGAQRALTNLIVLAVINLVLGMSPGIDNWGHIGGLIGGTLFAWFGGPVLRVEGSYPALKLVNQRESSSSLRAGIVVVTLFAMLAVLGIYRG